MMNDFDQNIDQYDTDELSDQLSVVDWAGTFRLALVVSILAAFAALLLVGLLPESTIVVAVIVAGTAASWYQLEHRPVRAGS
jgi:sterol desaturase/sphingolipid hydroxylase (fatty acid hydroxylase superfamily)